MRTLSQSHIERIAGGGQNRDCFLLGATFTLGGIVGAVNPAIGAATSLGAWLLAIDKGCF